MENNSNGAYQIYREEDDRKAIRRRQTNGVVTEPQNEADDEHLPLSLSLGSTSYSSQIQPMTSSFLLPPPSTFPPSMTTWPSSDFVAKMASSSAYFMTSPSYLTSSSVSNSFQSRAPVYPPSVFHPPPIQTPARSAISLTTSVVAPRRNTRSQSSRNQKTDSIPPPFPWATNKRGKIQSLEHLESKHITTITGDVQCKHCEKVYQVSYNLREKFSEVAKIFVMHKKIMRERAPAIWTNPELTRCELCGREKAVKPVIAERKSKINWLFLLLGQTLGHCTLEQLKNFCKHSKSHRTGAKDRVLFLTYLGLCKMLEPNRALFDRKTIRR